MPFQVFADIAKDAVESKAGESKRILLETYNETPDEFKTRCVSSVPFVIDASLMNDGLKETAIVILESSSKLDVVSSNNE